MPDSARPRETFAPIPARAMADDRLSALDLRVLAALAAHDRFGANGIGCFASHPRLAALVACHLKSLSRSLSILAAAGYIEAQPHPMNKRLRVYHVIYNRDDGAVMRSRIGNETATNANAQDGPIGNEPVPDSRGIGNRDFGKTSPEQGDAEVNILGEALRHPVKQKESSSEDASPSGGACNENGDTGNERQKIATRLRKLEDYLAEIDGRPLTRRERQYLAGAMRQCAEAADALLYSRHDELDEADRNLGHHAQRLAEAIADRVEGAAA